MDTEKEKPEDPHKHKEEIGMIGLAYAMAGKGHIGVCKICKKDFNKKTGELERAF